MKKGHYIWNRAERVDEKLMPKVVVDAFNRWQADEIRHLDHVSREQKSYILYRVRKQRRQMEESLSNLGYQLN
jgi:hypothetical protein